MRVGPVKQWGKQSGLSLSTRRSRRNQSGSIPLETSLVLQRLPAAWPHSSPRKVAGTRSNRSVGRR
jgi:hypothetical protein